MPSGYRLRDVNLQQFGLSTPAGLRTMRNLRTCLDTLRAVWPLRGPRGMFYHSTPVLRPGLKPKSALRASCLQVANDVAIEELSFETGIDCGGKRVVTWAVKLISVVSFTPSRA